MRPITWLKVAGIVIVAVVVQLAKSFAPQAHADSGGCPATVQGLATDASWARLRIQSLSGQPVTTGKLYSSGLISGFQARTFSSGYNADADHAEGSFRRAGS
jgi:hypothetical protein